MHNCSTGVGDDTEQPMNGAGSGNKSANGMVRRGDAYKSW